MLTFDKGVLIMHHDSASQKGARTALPAREYKLELPHLTDQSVFKPRPPGKELVLTGAGHDKNFPPADPRVVALQVVHSNAIERIPPSPELAALAGIDPASLDLADP
jgi:hypothetical protein